MISPTIPAWDGLKDHPEPVSAIIVCASEEMTPGCAELLVLKLDGDILLLGAPPVHLGDLTNVPVVVALAEPARQLLPNLQVVRQPRQARHSTLKPSPGVEKSRRRPHESGARGQSGAPI